MWRIILGVIVVAVVVTVIVLPVLGRWLVFRGNGVPFAWGLGPGRGMPFTRGPQPGGLWPSTGVSAPFSIIRGLANQAFLGLLIGLGIMFYRRWNPRRHRLDDAAPKPGNH